MKQSLILPKIAPLMCGTCRFHSPTPDLAIIQCNGVPPTPCIVGGQQTIAGMSYQVEVMSPMLPRTRPACALHQPSANNVN